MRSDWREWASLFSPIDELHTHRLRRYMQWRRAVTNRILKKLAEILNDKT